MKRSILLLVLALGCGGGGTYGYAPTYVPLSAEEDHLDAAVDLSYEEVRRDADGHVSTQLGWFGTVERLQVEGDRATVRLSLRTLAPRNLCADETDSSCRVTVSERCALTSQLSVKEPLGRSVVSSVNPLTMSESSFWPR